MNATIAQIRPLHNAATFIRGACCPRYATLLFGAKSSDMATGATDTGVVSYSCQDYHRLMDLVRQMAIPSFQVSFS